MSDVDKEELEFLEREYQELYIKESRERRHRRYLNIGAVVGIIFIIISTTFENEFYVFLGTLGMGILMGAAGLCILMSFIFLLPGVRAEENRKWEELEIKRRELDKLRKK